MLINNSETNQARLAEHAEQSAHIVAYPIQRDYLLYGARNGTISSWGHRPTLLSVECHEARTTGWLGARGKIMPWEARSKSWGKARRPAGLAGVGARSRFATLVPLLSSTRREKERLWSRVHVLGH